MDAYNGHVNGARYAITALHNHVIVAVIATGTHTGKEIFLPRIPFTPSADIYPFQMKRKQFPIRSAFAVTCNKSQGQSLKRIGLYLDRPMFSHGQLYVGLSCVGSPDNIRILLASEPRSDFGSTYTDNVVDPEVFAP